MAGRPTVLTYTLSNAGTTALGIAQVISATSDFNCMVSVTTLPAASVPAGGTTTLSVTVTPSASGSWSCSISFANTDLNENPYNWSVNGTALTQPELAVTRGTSIGLNGTDNVNASIVTVAGSPTVLMYTLANSGGSALGITLPVNVSNHNNCSASVSTAPAASVLAGSFTNLGLTVTPTVAGPWSLVVSFANTDSDENPFTWTIAGTALGPELDTSRAGAAIADGGEMLSAARLLAAPGC